MNRTVNSTQARTGGKPVIDAVRALPSGRWLDSVILVNRLGLGWYVLASGLLKVQRELGSGLGAFMRGDGFQSRSAILPEFLAVALGYAWPWVETISGLLLILGLFSRPAAAVIAWLLLSVSTALFFSGELLPLHYLMVFAPVALLLCLIGPGRYSLDGLRKGDG